VKAFVAALIAGSGEAKVAPAVFRPSVLEQQHS